MVTPRSSRHRHFTGGRRRVAASSGVGGALAGTARNACNAVKDSYAGRSRESRRYLHSATVFVMLFVWCMVLLLRPSEGDIASSAFFGSNLVMLTMVQGGGYVGAGLAELLRHQLHVTLQVYDKRDRVPASIRAKKSDPTALDLVGSANVLFLGEPNIRGTEVITEAVDVVEKMGPHQHFLVVSTGYEGVINARESEPVNLAGLSPQSRVLYEREQALLRHYNQNPETCPKITILRLGSIVGVSPSQRTDDIIPHMFAEAHSHGTIHVRFGGETKSFLSIHDLARVIQTILTAPPREGAGRVEYFNVASFQAREIQVANSIASMTGAKVVVETWLGPGSTISTDLVRAAFNIKFESTLESVLAELKNNMPASITPSGPYELIDNDPSNMACPVCGSKTHQHVLDVGKQPFANDFQPDVEKALASPRFPLRLIRCKKCNHLHLSHLASRDDLFDHYLYQSATSRTLARYFEWLAAKIIRQSGVVQGNVLEIACNDGTQLNFFREAGWSTYGVDPAANIVPLAQQQGHNVVVGYWGVDLNFPALPTGDKLHAIVAQNVFAHVPDNVAFLKKCVDVMGPKTKLYIQTSQCHMHQLGQFDTAYHEHVSFFTAHSFQRAAELSGLVITEFEITPIHGTSCLVTMMLPGPYQRKEGANSTTLQDRLALEVKDGLTSDYFYQKYEARAHQTRRWIVHQLKRFQREGYQIIAYGAAAKGMVLLHFFMQSQEASEFTIEFVLDDAPLKQNRYCAGTTIPVRPTSSLKSNTSNRRPLLILVLAWNFWDEIATNIKRELKDHIDEVLVLLPFPTPRLVHLKINQLSSVPPSVLLTMPFNPPSIPSALDKPGRRKAVAVVDICREFELLRQFTVHHAHMFDNAIVLNTCNSPLRETILGEAPISWFLQEDGSPAAIQETIREKVAGGVEVWMVKLSTLEFVVQSRFREELEKGGSAHERLRQLCMIPRVGDSIDHNAPEDIMTMYHDYIVKPGKPSTDITIMGTTAGLEDHGTGTLHGFVAKIGCSRRTEAIRDLNEITSGSSYITEYHNGVF